MRLVNLTNLALNPLIRFVEKHYDFADSAKVFVAASKQTDRYGRPNCGGTARSDGRVDIAMNLAAQYPRVQRLCRLTPEVRFEIWQEEFVMLLAHELRHIDQFALGAFPVGQELEAEVDAETYAAGVLEAYRASQKRVRRAA